MENDTEKKIAHEEKEFSKYKTRGSYHWKEMMSKNIRVFNAYHQAHYDWILKIAGDVKGKKILDIGCGDGVLAYLLLKAGAEVIGVDNEEYGLHYAEENLKLANHDKKFTYQFVCASAYALPFESESFDFVVSCEVVEHVREPKKMLAEAARVLRKGGKCILTTPHRLTESPLDVHHVTEYFPSEISGLLETDFKDVHIKKTHHLFWHALYTYSFSSFGGRPYGKWFINTLSLLFRWNPFMIDYQKPARLDMFATLCVWGSK